MRKRQRDNGNVSFNSKRSNAIQNKLSRTCICKYSFCCMLHYTDTTPVTLFQIRARTKHVVFYAQKIQHWALPIMHQELTG